VRIKRDFTKAGHIPNAKVIDKEENDVGLG
jgi:hypothetical protein